MSSQTPDYQRRVLREELRNAGSAAAPPSSDLALISSDLDSGNVEVLSVQSPSPDAVYAELALRAEPFTKGTDNKVTAAALPARSLRTGCCPQQHSQWFYFQAANVTGKSCRLTTWLAAFAGRSPALPRCLLLPYCLSLSPPVVLPLM